jgi:hypothetical protein
MGEDLGVDTVSCEGQVSHSSAVGAFDLRAPHTIACGIKFDITCLSSSCGATTESTCAVEKCNVYVCLRRAGMLVYMVGRWIVDSCIPADPLASAELFRQVTSLLACMAVLRAE